MKTLSKLAVAIAVASVSAISSVQAYEADDTQRRLFYSLRKMRLIYF
ncbi:MAG: hypothetical protein V7711_02110 [Pseudomonadales bacterium]